MNPLSSGNPSDESATIRNIVEYCGIGERAGVPFRFLEFMKVAFPLMLMSIAVSHVYLLWMLQRVIFGEVTKKENAELEDLEGREKVALLPLIAMAIVMGVAPMLFLRATEKSVNDVRQKVTGAEEKSIGSVR